jgi:hypothetical protein
LCLRASSVKTGDWGVEIAGRNTNIKVNLTPHDLSLLNSYFVYEDEGSDFFRNGRELLPLQKVLLFIVTAVRTSNLTFLYLHFCHNAEIHVHCNPYNHHYIFLLSRNTEYFALDFLLSLSLQF